MSQPISLSPKPASLYRVVLELLKSPHAVRLEEGSDRHAYSSIHLQHSSHNRDELLAGASSGLLEVHDFGDATLWFSLTDAGEQWMRGEPVLTQLEQTAPQDSTLWAAVFAATVFVSSEVPLEPTDAEVEAALVFARRMRAAWHRSGP